MNRYAEIFRRQSRPLEVIPTGQRPFLQQLDGIKAVVFDVYGTMFISGSGDIGVTDAVGHGEAFAEALTAAGFEGQVNGQRGVDCLTETIKVHHARRRAAGVDFPEVDIVAVWEDCLNEMKSRGWLTVEQEPADVRQLAVEYEVRTNPCWPMPDVAECLQRLVAAGLHLGVISNAQFYTLDMITGLLGKSADELGFDPDLQFYSYRYLYGKPSLRLYEMAATAVARLHIDPSRVLYVGNDMLKDIFPAAQTGFRTALFAGDRRSLRWRHDDERVTGTKPDLVLTTLSSLCDVLLTSPA